MKVHKCDSSVTQPPLYPSTSSYDGASKHAHPPSSISTKDESTHEIWKFAGYCQPTGSATYTRSGNWGDTHNTAPEIGNPRRQLIDFVIHLIYFIDCEMSSQPTLPFEIIEAIIDSLPQRQDPSLSSLKSCSLVCKSFLELCRKYIFASITVARRDLASSKPTSDALVRLLSTTPEIGRHVRILCLRLSSDEFDHPSLPRTLKRITKLESFTIYWCPTYKWRNNSLRQALLHLLHLPTLRSLHIADIRDFMLADLIPCSNLRELKFDCTTPVERKDISISILPDKPLQLHRLTCGIESPIAISMIGTSLRPDGKPIFNLAVLPSISIRFDTNEEFEASGKLLQHCLQLTDIDIFLNSPLIWTGIAKMLKPSLETLTHLHFSMSTKDETGANDPLAGLVSELDQIQCHRNVVENLTIDVFVGAYYKCNQGDDWGLLDSVLTQPGWSRLKRISLTISLWVCYREDDLEVTLKSLAGKQLPRLSSSTSIDFQFSVIDRSYD
ncbi:hypothetical protein M413DRAFT_32228 [Hebeloma cylindrosporum]|uniref:F-box domain-containing protein n=1 Tax=Hebeloma cylindrosporum TaxID=76867 RepID=A0A0C2XCZ5_HEBCY|nr:hypothetical protein M413DRAFT_32228 [Hebeloma cylindrosporum h7]